MPEDRWKQIGDVTGQIVAEIKGRQAFAREKQYEAPRDPTRQVTFDDGVKISGPES